jgi:hypothetical protein
VTRSDQVKPRVCRVADRYCIGCDMDPVATLGGTDRRLLPRLVPALTLAHLPFQQAQDCGWFLMQRHLACFGLHSCAFRASVVTSAANGLIFATRRLCNGR